jgi:hypothetical protein
LPPWIGAEITGQDRYHISAAFLPFVVAPQRGNSRRIRRTFHGNRCPRRKTHSTCWNNRSTSP